MMTLKISKYLQAKNLDILEKISQKITKNDKLDKFGNLGLDNNLGNCYSPVNKQDRQSGFYALYVGGEDREKSRFQQCRQRKQGAEHIVMTAIRVFFF